MEIKGEKRVHDDKTEERRGKEKRGETWIKEDKEGKREGKEGRLG